MMADFLSLSCYIVSGVVGMMRPEGLQADGLEMTEVQSVDAARECICVLVCESTVTLTNTQVLKALMCLNMSWA